MIALFLPGLAQAATLTVGASGYSSIQAAIEAAADGDEVLVEAGTWYGGVDFGGRGITVRSSDGAPVTVIDGDASFWAVTMDQGEGENAVLDGFTVSNADGGGIYLLEASPRLEGLAIEGVGASGYATPALGSFGGDPVVSSTTFEGNTAAYGGQTYVEGGAPTFERCSWRDGVAYYGGGMFLTGGASVSVTQSTFAGNEALFGGGALYVVAGSSFTGDQVDFADNVADASHGGAVFLEGSTTFGVTGGTFSGNAGANPTAYGQAGGAIFAAGAWVTVDGATFTGNEALYGGAISAAGGRVTLLDVDLDANVAAYGGAVSLDGDATLEDTGSTWTGNLASTHGGAVYASGGWYAAFTGGTFSANQAPNGYAGALYGEAGALSLDGVVFADNAAAYAGGALMLTGLDSPAVVRGAEFSANTTDDGPGGAIYAVNGAPLVIDASSFDGNAANHGGAVYAAYATDVSLLDTVFIGNRATAGEGGAVAHHYSEGEAGALSIAGGRFEGNAATADGGALAGFASARVLIADTVFADNEAGTDAAGGALFLTSSGATEVVRGWFGGNSGGRGGAVMVDGPLDGATFTNGLFLDNRAVSGGAFCVGGGGVHTWTNNTFVGNAATQDGGVGCLDAASATFVNNAVAYTADGAAVHEYDAAVAAGTTFAYNAFYENAEGTRTGAGVDPVSATGTETHDPLFVAWSADGDPENDVLVLYRGSPLVDAGSPDRTDPDGTPSDIGAYGGPDAPTTDQDTDGASIAADCDDADPNVHPGAVEIWYDGVDQDCSGGSDYDADGDGVDGPEGGGADCDDQDPTVAKDCDDPGDTADSAASDDTAGKGDGDATGGGCGCGGSAPTGGAPALILAALVLRRRRAP